MICGSTGFIWANFVLHWTRHHPGNLVVKFDAFTYTGNLENPEDVKVHQNYRFVHGDLQKTMDISKVFSEYNVEAVIHLAAE